MGSFRSIRLSVPVLGAAALFATAPAWADPTKAQCIDANTKGQDLLHDGKLTAARAQLQSCAVAACPKVIRGDCIKRVEALDAALPAIVFEAKDGAGNDLGAVTVTVDGAPLADKLDGTPLRVDPGEHVFVLTTAGAAPVTKKLILVEHDQSRRERIVFAPPAPPPPAPVVVPAPTPVTANESEKSAPPAESPSGGMSTLRTLGIVSGGVGVVGIGLGAVFGVLAGSALNSQRSDCASATNCANHAQALSDHSTFTTDGTVSTVGFVAGGVLLAAGVVMFFAGGKKEGGTTSGLVVAPEVGRGEAGLMVKGVF